jgi:hypothetical protein
MVRNDSINLARLEDLQALGGVQGGQDSVSSAFKEGFAGQQRAGFVINAEYLGRPGGR